MYDDRLEITSPGGMLDGSFVQNLDINKISSMRRNKIISDIFNRLHLMERRGSGLTRIVDSYSKYEIKPKFYSDTLTFKVIFPNRGYVEKAENDFNIINDKDYFILKMYKQLPDNIKKNTCEKIQMLFENFGYNNFFKRDDIERILNIKKTRANDLLKLLLENDLIVCFDNVQYKFKK